MSLPTIGFLGLGIMGAPMCSRLLAAGYPLIVYDIKEELIQRLEKEGAQRGINAEDVASRADISITMLPETSIVEKTFFGPHGIINGIQRGAIYIDMSTNSPVLARRIGEAAEKAGFQALDAPVSGGDVGAQKGTLSIMVGGNQETFDTVLPVFQVMGKTVTLCGGYGAGQVVKACNQIVVGVTIAGVAEALAFGTKAGIDPEKIVTVLGGGLARCGILENRGMRMVHHDFQPGGPCRVHHKDMRIIMAEGENLGIPLPFSSQVYDLFKEMILKGRSEYDHTGLLTLMEERACIDTGEPD